jgi:drug/metabolite transporter (DMT)-like permease
MLAGVANLKTLADLACVGFAFLLYSLVMHRLAQAILTLQSVCVIIAAAVLLNEPISDMRWTGMAIIIAGEPLRLRFEFFGVTLADQRRRSDRT